MSARSWMPIYPTNATNLTTRNRPGRIHVDTSSSPPIQSIQQSKQTTFQSQPTKPTNQTNQSTNQSIQAIALRGVSFHDAPREWRHDLALAGATHIRLHRGRAVAIDGELMTMLNCWLMAIAWLIGVWLMVHVLNPWLMIKNGK